MERPKVRMMVTECRNNKLRLLVVAARSEGVHAASIASTIDDSKRHVLEVVWTLESCLEVVLEGIRRREI